MTDFDIVLAPRTKEYNIKIESSNTANVIIIPKNKSYDICVINLTDRQGIYGDEIRPLISHIYTSSLSISTKRKLFDSYLVCDYDASLLNELDKYGIYSIDYGGGMSNIKLNTRKIDLISLSQTKLDASCVTPRTSTKTNLTTSAYATHSKITPIVKSKFTYKSIIHAKALISQLKSQVFSDIKNKSIATIKNKSMSLFLRSTSPVLYQSYITQRQNKMIVSNSIRNVHNFFYIKTDVKPTFKITYTSSLTAKKHVGISNTSSRIFTDITTDLEIKYTR